MDDIRITRGNDFTIRVRLYANKSEERVPVSVADIQELSVKLRNAYGQYAQLTFVAGLDNDIDVSVDGKTIGNGCYTIEVCGLIDDRDIRACEPCVFHIVEKSDDANVTSDIYDGSHGVDYDMTFQFLASGSGEDSTAAKINKRIDDEIVAREQADTELLANIQRTEHATGARINYNPLTKTIDLINSTGLIISSVDATEFIKDGMVESVQVQGGNLVITFNTESGKQPISIPLSVFFDATNYYTKAQTEQKIIEGQVVKDLGAFNIDIGSLSGIRKTTANDFDLKNIYDVGLYKFITINLGQGERYAGLLIVTNVGANDIHQLIITTNHYNEIYWRYIKDAHGQNENIGEWEYFISAGISDSLANKVDKVAGMGLSENNFTNAYKQMLDNTAIVDLGEVECWQDSQWVSGTDIDDVLTAGIYKFVAIDVEFSYVNLPSLLFVVRGEGAQAQLLIGGNAADDGLNTFYRYYNDPLGEWGDWNPWLVYKDELATVATTGSYTDLSHTPTIPDSADDISYDNTTSGLTATNVQDAIDEVAQGGGGGGATVNDMLKQLYINYDERPATDSNRCKFNATSGYFEMNGLTDLTFDDMAAVYRAGNNPLPYLITRGSYLQARTNYCNGMVGNTAYPKMDYFMPQGIMEVLNLGRGIYLSTVYASFYYVPTLKRVIGVVNFNNVTSTYLFTGCKKLTYVELKGISNSIYLFTGSNDAAKGITYECMSYIVSNANTVSSKTITTNATLYSYLTGTATPPETTGGTTAQWQQLFTDLQTKGWTIASE